jgi:hypothetical protein
MASTKPASKEAIEAMNNSMAAIVSSHRNGFCYCIDSWWRPPVLGCWLIGCRSFEKQTAIKKALGLPALCQKNILWNVCLLVNLLLLSCVSPRLLALRAAGLVGKTTNIACALA